MAFGSAAGAAGLTVAVLALIAQRFRIPVSATAVNDAVPSFDGSPYDVLGLASDAEKDEIVQAYRALAKKWHPDRNRGAEATAEKAFAVVSHAYEILTNPEKREILDRLGVEGLERMRDGDPSVHKDWLPPDEVLRRLHDDGDEPWLQSLVTSGFASFSTMLTASERRLMPSLRALAVGIGIYSALPSVVITATETASGAALSSGHSASTAVTFKFALSGKSFDFDQSDVTHENCERPKFLGMKTTFYLQCEHSPGGALTVSVPANAFTVVGRGGRNAATEPFVLMMV